MMTFAAARSWSWFCAGVRTVLTVGALTGVGLAATRDLGGGFRDHGVATPLTAFRVAAPDNPSVTYEPMPTEHHSTIFPTAALHGIRTLFAAPEISATE